MCFSAPKKTKKKSHRAHSRSRSLSLSFSTQVEVSLNPAPAGCPPVFETPVVRDSLKPSYGKAQSTFTWTLPSSINTDSVRVLLRCVNKDGGKRQETQGSMSFTLAEIEDDDTPTEGWFRLLDDAKGKNQNQPFRVKRRQEMTREEMEIYGVSDAVPASALKVPAAGDASPAAPTTSTSTVTDSGTSVATTSDAKKGKRCRVFESWRAHIASWTALM